MYLIAILQSCCTRWHNTLNKQKVNPTVWLIHQVWKKGEKREKKHSSSLLASDVTPPLYSPSLSIYEASWRVMKRKGQGECVFIRSKPIGQISTFHATTLWLQLVPFWLKQYIHLGHSYIISPILHLIGNVTQTAGRYYGIDLLQGLVRSPRYDINGV